MRVIAERFKEGGLELSTTKPVCTASTNSLGKQLSHVWADLQIPFNKFVKPFGVGLGSGQFRNVQAIKVTLKQLASSVPMFEKVGDRHEQVTSDRRKTVYDVRPSHHGRFELHDMRPTYSGSSDLVTSKRQRRRKPRCSNHACGRGVRARPLTLTSCPSANGRRRFGKIVCRGYRLKGSPGPPTPSWPELRASCRYAEAPGQPSLRRDTACSGKCWAR